MDAMPECLHTFKLKWFGIRTPSYALRHVCRILVALGCRSLCVSGWDVAPSWLKKAGWLALLVVPQQNWQALQESGTNPLSGS